MAGLLSASPKTVGRGDIATLIVRVFATRKASHKAHWATASYAQHMALGDFYDALPDKIDAIVEAIQGNTGQRVKTDAPEVGALLSQIEAEADWIKAQRSTIAQGVPAIENMLDDLAGAYLAAAYKLRMLK